MSDPSFSVSCLLDIFHLNTVLNLGHELCATELASHGLAVGHTFCMGMYYIGYYKKSTFQAWSIFFISAENTCYLS